MPYACYIIFSKRLDRYYVGHTENIDIRIVQHNMGLSQYTSKATDWILVYHEYFENRTDAHKRELEIKKKKSRKYIQWLVSKT